MEKYVTETKAEYCWFLNVNLTCDFQALFVMTEDVLIATACKLQDLKGCTS
jgi:hypothetical protein